VTAAVASRTRTKAESNGSVFDVEAAAQAAAAEAGDEAMPFTLRGETFTIPPTKAWPVKVSKLLAAGEITDAIGMLLGKEMDRFLLTEPTLGEVEALFAQVAKWSGVGGLGN